MKPKTERVRNLVFRAILRADYRPGDRIPTERDMASATGTSRVTVRQAYNELEMIGILERVQGRGTTIATRLRGHSETTGPVAVLTAVRDPFAASFLYALEDALARESRLLVLKCTEENAAREESAAMSLVEQGVRDIVVWPSGVSFAKDTFQRLRILGTNLVFFDRIRPGSVADFVGLDNTHAIRLLFERALRKAHRQYIFVSHSGLDADSDREREDAFLNVCSDQKLSGDIVRVPWGVHSLSYLETMRKEWFSDLKRLGIFSVNDALGLAIRQLLGPDVSIYSIDGLPESAHHGLVSVRQPFEQLAQRAILCLQNQKKRGDAWVAGDFRCKGDIL